MSNYIINPITGQLQLVTAAPVGTDDAIAKKHTQNTDQKLDEGGSNEISVTMLKTALEEITTLQDNLVITDWRLQIANGISLMKFVDSYVDEFQDQTGIDSSVSVNQIYDAVDKFYSGITEVGYDEYTKFLLHYDIFPLVDEGEHTIVNTNVLIDSIIKKFTTGASGIFDGTSLLNVNSSDLAFGAGDFTVETCVNFSTVGNKGIFQISDTIGGIKAGFSDTVALFYNGTDFGIYFNNTYTSAAYSITPGAWYHVAIVKYNNVTTLYVNGHAILSGADNLTYTGTYLAIGGYYNSGYYFNGRQDEFRVSNTARWTADFTPLTIPYAPIPPIVTNISLVSQSTEADVQPDKARIVALIEPIDAIIINTDVKAFVSEDDGAHYDELVLVDETYFDGTKIVYAASKNLTDYGDKTLRWKINTYNTKAVKIHGIGLLWK